jgi:ABC-type Mn2+/Zn2+ transport system ATPase subunit
MSRPSTGVPLVRFERVTLGYGDHPVISDLSFAVERGDFLGIVGPNGAGKSTVLKAMLGLIEPRAGSVTYGAEVHRDLR